MPLHDWTRVPSGLFHHLHQDWSIEITRALNRGRLPKGLSALVEQRAGVKEPDVLTIEQQSSQRSPSDADTPVGTMERPTTRFVRRTTKQIYATRANRIVMGMPLPKAQLFQLSLVRARISWQTVTAGESP